MSSPLTNSLTLAKPDCPVLPAIRTFCNTDVAVLCKVWNAHYGDLGAACRMTPLQLELVCLAKPYFSADDVFIAEFDEQVVGFLHLGPVARDDLREARDDLLAIAALCVVPCDEEDSVAQALLRHVERVLRRRNIARCSFKPLLPGCPFYQGLGPADSMIGATTSERRCCQWLKAAGFIPSLPTSQWELDLSTFQVPVDRQQIQIRRGTHVERESDEPTLPWWQACWLGHTEPTRFNFYHRAQGQLVCDALTWSVAVELQTSPDAIAWLWPPHIPQIELGAEQLLFLVGEVCRQMQSERVDVVRTVSAASDTQLNALLRRLGFVAEHSGVVMEKQLA